jgi:hypothetical protein
MSLKKQAKFVVLKNYGKLLEDVTLAVVVLMVEGECFPSHRVILATRRDYFRGLFLSGIQGRSSEGGVQEIEQVSSGAFWVVPRYLLTAELLESGEGGAGGGGGRGEGSTGSGGRGGGKAKQFHCLVCMIS